METASRDVGHFLEQTYDSDPRVRKSAVVHLCPCHVKRNRDDVWDRMLSMAHDGDRDVRNAVLHVLTDGSPRDRALQVVGILEAMQGDVDARLRRKARHILAHYRRTGDLNIS